MRPGSLLRGGLLLPPLSLVRGRGRRVFTGQPTESSGQDEVNRGATQKGFTHTASNKLYLKAQWIQMSSTQNIFSILHN